MNVVLLSDYELRTRCWPDITYILRHVIKAISLFSGRYEHTGFDVVWRGFKKKDMKE